MHIYIYIHTYIYTDIYIDIHTYIELHHSHIQTQNDSGQPPQGPKKMSSKNDHDGFLFTLGINKVHFKPV